MQKRKKVIGADALEYIYARMKDGLNYRDAKKEFDEKFELVDKAELEGRVLESVDKVG